MSIEDRLYRFLSLYDSCPPLIRKVVARMYTLIPESRRMGHAYPQFKKLVQETEFLPADELRNYQEQQFLNTIEWAKKTAFYPRYYREHGVDIHAIQSLDDIGRLPLIEKQHIQDHIDDFVNPEQAPRGLYLTTGGSTGIPVSFYLEKGISRAKELAFMENQWERAGYKKSDRCAVIRGTVVSSKAQGMLSKMDYFRNWLMLSSYHLTEQNLPTYIQLLNEFQPAFIQGYPSALAIMAKFINQSGQRLTFPITGVLAGSENIYPHQRGEIETAFNSTIYTWYGLAERVLLGGYCQHSQRFHLFPQYGYGEVLQDNRIVTSGGGHLVGTSFHNSVMPLIRYRTEDRVTLSKKQHCACGRNYLFLDTVDGREQELIVSATGRKISMTAINMHSPVFEHIKQFQFFQDSQGTVQFRYIPLPSFQERDTVQIVYELYNKLGDDFELYLEAVNTLPLSKSGKHTFLIQKLNVS